MGISSRARPARQGAQTGLPAHLRVPLPRRRAPIQPLRSRSCSVDRARGPGASHSLRSPQPMVAFAMGRGARLGPSVTWQPAHPRLSLLHLYLNPSRPLGFSLPLASQPSTHRYAAAKQAGSSRRRQQDRGMHQARGLTWVPARCSSVGCDQADQPACWVGRYATTWRCARLAALCDSTAMLPAAAGWEGRTTGRRVDYITAAAARRWLPGA